MNSPASAVKTFRFSARHLRIRPAAILILAFAAVMSAAVDARAKDEGEASGKARDYRELVKGLVSPNKPIEIKDPEARPTLPPDYDGTPQAEIERNRRILYEHCDEALPFLIEGCTDPRYSLTWQSDSFVGNSSVGEVCLEIIASHLEIYRSHMRFTKLSYYAYRFVPRMNHAIGEHVTDEKKKEIQEWWRTRKGKTLAELQIEALDWAIEKRRNDYGTRDEGNATQEVELILADRNKIKKDGKCLPPEYIPPSIQRSGSNKVGK